MKKLVLSLMLGMAGVTFGMNQIPKGAYYPENLEEYDRNLNNPNYFTLEQDSKTGLFAHSVTKNWYGRDVQIFIPIFFKTNKEARNHYITYEDIFGLIANLFFECMWPFLAEMEKKGIDLRRGLSAFVSQIMLNKKNDQNQEVQVKEVKNEGKRIFKKI